MFFHGKCDILTISNLEDGDLGPKGAKANIEVQRSDNDDHQRRVRYNASAITMNFTPPGARFEDIPDVVEKKYAEKLRAE